MNGHNFVITGLQQLLARHLHTYNPCVHACSLCLQLPPTLTSVGLRLPGGHTLPLHRLCGATRFELCLSRRYLGEERSRSLLGLQDLSCLTALRSLTLSAADLCDQDVVGVAVHLTRLTQLALGVGPAQAACGMPQPRTMSQQGLHLLQGHGLEALAGLPLLRDVLLGPGLRLLAPGVQAGLRAVALHPPVQQLVVSCLPCQLVTLRGIRDVACASGKPTLALVPVCCR